MENQINIVNKVKGFYDNKILQTLILSIFLSSFFLSTLPIINNNTDIQYSQNIAAAHSGGLGVNSSVCKHLLCHVLCTALNNDK